MSLDLEKRVTQLELEVDALKRVIVDLANIAILVCPHPLEAQYDGIDGYKYCKLCQADLD